MKQLECGPRLRRKGWAYILQHPMSLSVGYLLLYLPAFAYLERRTVTSFHLVHCGLDDALPFLPVFVIPYVLWFLLVPGILLYFAHAEQQRYFELCWLLFGGMTICLMIYLVYPTCLDLRGSLDNTGVLNSIVGLIRAVDTPTNVCPSIHVSSTIAVMLEVAHSQRLREHRLVRIGLEVLGVAICCSTVFLDQHSVVDVICGLALTLVLWELMVWWQHHRHTAANLSLSRG